MKIGLTYTGTEEKHQNYIRWLKGSTDEIEIVTLSSTIDNLSDLNNCNALVLAGGRDIHPGVYNNTNWDYPNSPRDFDLKRDQFEIDAFKLAQKHKVPVLAICRGLQLVNCIFEGTLCQDLGDPLNKIHRAEETDKIHEIIINEDTLLSEIVLLSHMQANSAHHQSIEKLGKELVINCTSDHGTIEGIEWANKLGKPFFLGIQWHPERMFKFNLQETAASRLIRERFIEEIKKTY